MSSESEKIMEAEEKDHPHDDFDGFSFLQIVAEYFWLLSIVPLSVGLFALAISFCIRPTFLATTVILPPQHQQSVAAALLQTFGVLTGHAAASSALRNPTEQYVALLGSRSIQDQLIDNFELIKRYGVNDRFEARRALVRNTRITTGKENLIRIDVEDNEPEVAAQIANAYVAGLSELIGRLGQSESKNRKALYENELNKAKDALNNAELALKKTGIDPTAIKASPEISIQTVANLMAQISLKEVQISAMSSSVTESSPEFKKAMAELNSLKAQLRKEELGNSSLGKADYVEKYRDYRYYSSLYELIAKQYEIARVDESRAIGVIQVVDYAIAPERKYKPKKALIASVTSIITGVLLIVMLFFWRWYKQLERTNAKFSDNMNLLKKTWGSSLSKPLAFFRNKL